MTKDRKSPTVGALTPTAIREMIAICVRNREAFELVSPYLNSSHLYLQDPAYSVVWVALETFFADNQSLPDLAEMTVMVASIMEDDVFRSVLTTAQSDLVLQIVDMAYDESAYDTDVATSSTKVRFAATIAKSLLGLIERNRVEALIQDRTKMDELPSLLQRAAERISGLDALLAKPSGSLFPEGWDTRMKLTLVPTGVEPLDRFYGGGGASGEVLAFLAPFGSCKTTSAVQSVVAIAKMCKLEYFNALEQARREGKPIESIPVPVVLYASYETPVAEFRHRCLAFAAQVPKSRLASMDGLHSLRQSGQEPLEYEREEFADLIARHVEIPSEADRIRNVIPMLDRHIIILDMTGREADRQAIGGKGVEELAASVKQELRYRNAVAKAIWVDHISAMVDQLMVTTGGDDKAANAAIMRAPQSLVRMIAGPLGIPCYIVHQLNGEANGRSATYNFSMADSSGSKSFAKYLDFMVVATKPNEQQVCLFQCVKSRRQPPANNRLVLVDGDFNRVRDVSDTYVIDEATRSIVRREEIEAVASALPADTGRRRAVNTII